MIHLILAIVFTTLMLVIFKLIGMYRLNVEQAVTFNYLFAAVTGFVMLPQETQFRQVVDKEWIFYALVAAIMFMVNFYVFAAASKKDGVAITAVSSKMSVVIPVTAGFLLFKDSFEWIKLVGIFLGLFSFYLILKPEQKVKVNKEYIYLPLLLFLGTGANDTIIKYVQFNFLNGDENIFVDTVFLFSFITSLFVLIWRMYVRKLTFDKKSIFMGLLLGAVNYFGAWNFLKSMSYLQSSVLFPVINVSVVALSALIGIIIFKEKFKKINIIGLFIAMISILLISLG